MSALAQQYSFDPEVEQIRAKCAYRLGKHCRTFHPERFTRPFSPSHTALFEAIDDPRFQKILVLAHRGFGKTSIFNFGLPSQNIIFEKVKFIVPVSASSTAAVMQSENLKRELESNLMIRSIIGEIKSGSYSKDQWITANGIMVLPRGRGQQIRGILHGHIRPQLIIVDDLEDSESVMSTEQRQKTKEWFYSDLMNCVDRAKGDWKIVVVGTILHEASLLQELREDDIEKGGSWKVLDLPLCDEHFKPYWPEFMSQEQIKADLVDEYKRQGLTEVFYREYMNIANPPEDAVFKAEYFQTYDEQGMDLNHNRDVDNVILVDPAKTAKQHSAFTAIIGVGIDTSRSKVYVRDAIIERIPIDQVHTCAIDMAQRLNAKVIGVEETGIKEWIRQPFISEALRRGKSFEFIWLTARQGKVEGQQSLSLGKAANKGKFRRIAALASYYRLGQIYHNPRCCDVLEAQLVAFPRGKYVDGPDALSYFIQMMELGERYFEESPDMDLEAPEDDYTKMEDEYKELMEEDEEPWEVEHGSKTSFAGAVA